MYVWGSCTPIDMEISIIEWGIDQLNNLRQQSSEMLWRKKLAAASSEGGARLTKR